MIEGLDAVAKRAEKLEAREAAKRKSGGKMNANIALHVDDTGRRWSFAVKLGIAGALFLGVAFFAVLMILANRKSLSPKQLTELTRRDMDDLTVLLQRMEHFDDGETVTLDKVQERLQKKIDLELGIIIEQLEVDRKQRRLPNRSSLEERNMLMRLKELKDPAGKPYELKIEGDDSVKAIPPTQSDVIKTVIVRVRGGKKKKPVPPPEESAQQPEPPPPEPAPEPTPEPAPEVIPETPAENHETKEKPPEP